MKLERQISSIKVVDGLAVLLIICGVMFAFRPLFERAKADNAATCAAHMKQIGLGLIEYSQDYDNKWPGGSGHWAGDLFPYLKNAALYHCPDDTASFPQGDKISYALNANLQGVQGGNSVVALTQPSRTVAAIEYNGTSALIDWSMDNVSRATSGNGLNGAWGMAILGHTEPSGPLRHDPYVNVLECDGHVKELRAMQVSSGRDNLKATGPQTTVVAAGTAALGSKYMVTFSEK